MPKLWYQDEMILQDQQLELLSNERAKAKNISTTRAIDEIQKEVKSKVNVFVPDWASISVQELNPLTSGKQVSYIKMKLDFELEPASNARFEEARYHAYIFTKNDENGAPRVYDLFPKDLYEGESKKIHLSFNPEINILDSGGSLGEISGDIHLGRIEPVIVGYFGEEKRKPHWSFQPDTKALLGIKSMWLVLEIPENLLEFNLCCEIEADLKTKAGIFALTSESNLRNRTQILTIKIK